MVPKLPLVKDQEVALREQSQKQRKQYQSKAFKLLIIFGICIFVVYYKAYTNITVHDDGLHIVNDHHGPAHGHHMTAAQHEKLYLSIPSPESALAASRAYATHPHLAGSSEDFEDAKVMLQLFQEEFHISPPKYLPIFPAGTADSRHATLDLTSRSRASPSAWIDVYYPVLNTPLDRSVDILGTDGKATWSADLQEDGDPLDPEAAKYKDSVPTFHGLSADGDVEGQLIFANYGSKEDYDALVASGANLTGKIVIARYGAIFRGLKVLLAEEHGAAGVLLYSDPRDDGTVTVENGYSPYPAGPSRNPTSVQRGSVQYISLYPGDPTTPGRPAYENVTRSNGDNIPKIPSLPISWTNAERLLEEIGGVNGEGRKLDGKVSETKIRLVNHVDTKVTPIWNTMAAIPGHIKDEVVVIGCHRDAWVMGAADPTSGTVSLHEVIRGFGSLLKRGWKPLRTILFASWDAEEYGLVGSTEWGEDFSEWISAYVVAYINVDISVAGSTWSVSGSPSLAHLIHQTALDVPHPTTPGKTLWDARDDRGPFTGKEVDTDFMASYEAARKERKGSKTGVSPLGSGSDYTVFLQRIGVASVDQGFGMSPYDAVYHYHSIYDSQKWQETYGDPGFFRHVAVSRHLGLMALRIIDSIVIPLNTTQYALELDEYLDKVETIISTSSLSLDFSSLRKSLYRLQAASIALDVEKNEAEKAFKKILRRLPRRGKCKRSRFRRVVKWIKRLFGHCKHGHHQYHRQKTVPEAPPAESWEDYVHYGARELRGSWDIQHSAHTVASSDHDDVSVSSKGHDGLIKAAKRVQKANSKLVGFERGLISKDGLSGREWYKHLGVAPGKLLGYGATTLPALTEAITIYGNATLAKHETRRLTDLISKLADELRA